MRTYSVLAYGAGLVLGAALSVAQAAAFEGARPAAAPVAPGAPLEAFKSVKEAFRSGIRDYNAGDKSGAVRALEYAATQGHTLALWKLGRMYAEGDGVAHDDLKAFEYFSKIADQYADESPDSPNARFVSSAFVALGGYFLDGISGTYVRPNTARAVEMFHYAATYYGDADAQYNLGRLYLDGNGVPKNPRQAARWFNLSAEKGNHQAQALLGHLLVTGQGVPRQSARGLMWLTIARDAADPTKDAWIVELHDKAFAAAKDNDRQAALIYLEQQLKKIP
ncbi:tetratricopeptide repeat protein [Chelatococcus sp. SYSU_G07232]|uniref:Tetratricopeptide repeat protein n=1 Tax=Chelatococcus albus TaxID=3047466 RepID=A0ABT7AEG8_9HYPH|nr:tetratricopeptide repeat protein [Chelatococcus sp. SYSU_G07232]MDJ1157016.1 tetratricopeptide repeat protein [Chelatococcus sp. SYSU_G07232]